GLFLGTAALAKVTVSQDGTKTTYNIHVDDVAFSSFKNSGKKFQRAHLKGVEGYEGVHYDIGAPELPVVRLYVDGEVEVAVSDEAKVWTNKSAAPLMPSQPSRIKQP